MLVTLSVLKEYIQAYYAAVFRKGYFISIACMLAVIISLYYNNSFSKDHKGWVGFFTDYTMYLVPFAFSYLMQWFYFDEDRTHFSKTWFWILLLIAPAIFAFRVNFNLNEIEESRYTLSVINYASRAIALMIPVAIIWYLKDRKQYKMYGIGFSNNGRLYLLLLAMMIPLVLIAAMLPDFLTAYPKAMSNAGLYVTDNPGRLIIFELAYALDFLSIEFFFRGFLIIAFIKYCGMKAIVPAACFYCCIHLGKPMPEAISSFFGGLLLGIISYHTLSIWGGLIIHIGIAWVMEIAAYISHHF